MNDAVIGMDEIEFEQSVDEGDKLSEFPLTK